MAMKEHQNNGRVRVWGLLLALWFVGLHSLLPGLSHARSAAEVLKTYERLTGKEREAKLIEGAKREGKMVYYGSTAIDHSKRILDAFKKKYPFIKTGHYRSGGINVYNRITSEARAKRRRRP